METKVSRATAIIEGYENTREWLVAFGCVVNFALGIAWALIGTATDRIRHALGRPYKQ